MSIEGEGDFFLAEWAKWAVGDFQGLGYPRRCVTEKANEGGLTAGSPKPPTEIPPEVAKTDAAVAQIRIRHKSVLWRAIKIKYLERSPLEGVMRSMGVNRSEANHLVNRAQRAVYLIRAAL